MRIRELRKAKKVTMKELGNMIGVAESTMSLYETGKRKPDPETLSRLADYFNVSVDYLLGRDEGQPQPAPKYSTDQRKEIVLKKLEKKSLAQLEAILVALGDDGK
jgi:transcriptional regulator with XRE-family HTH domain